MNRPKFHNFSEDWQSHRKKKGIQHDPNETIEGLWSEEKGRELKKFEDTYPGISDAFDRLIALLPDPHAPEKSEYPFAASVVRVGAGGKIEEVARTENRVNKQGDSTQHAELAVLQDAQKALGNKHLDGYFLLSTAQPCEMCAGAIRNTHIGSVVYGVSQKDLEGTHVKFQQGYKPIRTVPAGVNIDTMLRKSGVNVYAGYKRAEVLAKMRRTHGSWTSYYSDPDA